MNYEPLKVVFHLDGSGVVYFPDDPPHLDGLLAWASLYLDHRFTDIEASEAPIEPDLPLACKGEGDRRYWSASVLLPPSESAVSIQMARRKVRDDRVELTSGTINKEIGQTKAMNRPWPLVLTHSMVGFCVGDIERVRRLCREIRGIGKERARGKGRVVSFSVEPFDSDFSIEKDGWAMRYIPSDGGDRLVRCRPPYWHPMGAVMCISPGMPMP